VAAVVGPDAECHDNEKTALLGSTSFSGNSPGLYADPLGRREDITAVVVAAAAPAAIDAGRPRAPSVDPSTADELGKYFDLKEIGAITQEEFDAFKAKLRSE